MAYGVNELNLGFTVEDDAEVVRRNRLRFAEAVTGEAGMRLATVRQVHGMEVVRAQGEGLEADGMVTDEVGVALGIQVADCVPVLVADTRLRVVGAFHAGWRGTVGGIAGRGIARMTAEFGSRAEDMVGAVGPSVGQCCYEVGEAVRGRFEEAFPYAEELFAGRRLDLWEANRRQLVDAGVRQVQVVGECSVCALGKAGRKYFSYRGDGGRTGRGMGIIGIK